MACIDANVFPHIIDGIFDAADPSSLRSLRVCREWSAAANARLPHHIAIKYGTVHSVVDSILYRHAPLHTPRAEAQLSRAKVLDVIVPRNRIVTTSASVVRVRPTTWKSASKMSSLRLTSDVDTLVLLPFMGVKLKRHSNYPIFIQGSVRRVVHHLARGSLANPYLEAELVLVLHDVKDWKAETAEIFLNSIFPTHNTVHSTVAVFGASGVMTSYLRDMVEINGLPLMEEGSTVSDLLRAVVGDELQSSTSRNDFEEFGPEHLALELPQ